jgi:hypothetical protein
MSAGYNPDASAFGSDADAEKMKARNAEKAKKMLEIAKAPIPAKMEGKWYPCLLVSYKQGDKVVRHMEPLNPMNVHCAKDMSRNGASPVATSKLYYEMDNAELKLNKVKIPIVIQTPWLNSTFGAAFRAKKGKMFDDMYAFDSGFWGLDADEEKQAFFYTMKALEMRLMDLVYQHRSTWMKKPNLSRDGVEAIIDRALTRVQADSTGEREFGPRFDYHVEHRKGAAPNVPVYEEGAQVPNSFQYLIDRCSNDQKRIKHRAIFTIEDIRISKTVCWKAKLLQVQLPPARNIVGCGFVSAMDATYGSKAGGGASWTAFGDTAAADAAPNAFDDEDGGVSPMNA